MNLRIDNALINFENEEKFLDQRTGKYKKLGFREYLISYNYAQKYGWSVLRVYEQSRINDCSIDIIRRVETAQGDFPCFNTLAQAKAWIRSVGGKHVKHYNSSY